jgi:hypothetical protein
MIFLPWIVNFGNCPARVIASAFCEAISGPTGRRLLRSSQ